MDLATLLFWVIAIILVGSSLLVVGLRNIVHSALALVVVFAMAAGIYLLLNAEFIAIVQILIYAGAVTILILFALMLTRTNNLSTNSNPINKMGWLGAIISTLVGAGIIFAVTLGPYSTAHAGGGAGYGPQNAACPLPPNNVAYIGLYGALTKRNAIAVLMGIEIMLNAVNVTMVGFAFYNTVKPWSTYLTGQIFAIFIITVAAAEAAVALAMIISIYRKRNTVDVGEINLMKW